MLPQLWGILVMASRDRIWMVNGTCIWDKYDNTYYADYVDLDEHEEMGGPYRRVQLYTDDKSVALDRAWEVEKHFKNLGSLNGATPFRMDWV